MNTANIVQNIRKTYGAKVVLEDVSVELTPGEVCILVGANGAGKSTLLKIWAGLLKPDIGRVEVSAQNSIGYVGHESMLYQALTVAENVELMLALADSQTTCEELLRQWSLSEYHHHLVSELSKGNKARLSLLRAFWNNPRLVLLDEPSSALDSRGLELLLECLRKSKQSKACILVASHDLARLLKICDRFLVLEKGIISKDLRGEASESLLNLYIETNT